MLPAPARFAGFLRYLQDFVAPSKFPNRAVDTAIDKFLEAHQRYLALELARTECTHPAQRERMHIAILRAYLELLVRARVITGLQYADGMEFADSQ